MTTMMSDLPQDLVEEILSRVSAISLKRLRSTCKRWNALFKDHKFRKRHFSKAPKQSQILMLKEYKVCPMSVNLNVAPPSIRFNGVLSLKDSCPYSEQVYIVNVFHCNGLLLCTTKNYKLVVWNPCLGETRWIHHKTGYNSNHKFALGYQNLKSGNSYKILMWYTTNDYEDVVKYEIFKFNSNSWRILNDVNLNCFIQANGVSVKGNTYWIATDLEERVDNILISFDFTRKRFRRLYLPESMNNNIMLLSSVGGEEEQLSLLRRIPDSSKVEIWVSSNIDTEKALFSKSFVVDLLTYTNWYHDTLGLLIDEEKKVVLFCNRWNMVYTIGENDEYYTEIFCLDSTKTPRWLHWCPQLLNYVPSLVQIQQGRCKRKERT